MREKEELDDPGDIVAPRAPLETRHVTEWPEWILVAVLGAIFVAFGTAIWMDKESRELPRTLASVPLLIGELHPDISEVIEKAPDGALQITLDEASPMYPASVVTGIAGDALVILRRMHEFFPQIDNRVVRFVAKAPLHPTDAGLRALAPVLALDFERSEVLARVVAPEFTLQDLLNQASAVRYLNEISGPRYVAAFCRDPVASSAAVFCERKDPGS